MEKKEKDTTQEVINKITIDFNKALKKQSAQSDVFQKKVLLEKCKNGREMSSVFIDRAKTWYPNIHKKLDSVEGFMEKDIISFLQSLDIVASVKTDKHSLPYTDVVVSKLTFESDVAAMFNYRRTYREIIKELLNKNVYKIRFYVHIETYDDESSGISRLFQLCGVKYSFRYYIH